MEFLYKKSMIRFLVVITGIYVIYYIWWRMNSTLNPAAMVFSLLLLFSEVQGIINFYLFSLMTWNFDKSVTSHPSILEGISVDVFVPTYNEDIKILEATLVGCISMRYNHTTYILDDGRRPEVKELAKRLGCGYLTREDNQHAKAGNINAALKNTNGEFIAVFDADMVPQPDFLEKTLGYFRDNKTAIVQLPQEFYNLDSIQHQESAAYWHEQQLFYRIIQPGKDGINAAFWCGSPSIVRREALESIGGVATESITEDFLTSIRLNCKGWKIRFHNEVLAFGIAPQSLHAFNLQRLRWAQGAMKILKSKDNPLIVPGLTIKQRLSHFSAIFTYFDSFQKLVYLLVPAIYLITGIEPVKANSGWNFLIHWFPYFFLLMITNIAIGRGYFKYIRVEKYNMLKIFTFIKASLTLFWSKNLKFRVTPKVVESSVKQKEKREIKFHIIVLIMTALTVVLGIINYEWNVLLTYSRKEIAAYALFWSLANIFILTITLYDVLKRVYYRNDYRFPVQLSCSIEGLENQMIEAEVTDISNSGISLLKRDDLKLGSRTRVYIKLSNEDVIGISSEVVYDKKVEEGYRKIGIKFEELSSEDRIKLNYFLFVKTPREAYALIENTGRLGSFDYSQKRNRNILGKSFMFSIYRAISRGDSYNMGD